MRCTNSEAGLHSVEGTVGFEMVSDLFVDLAFEMEREERYRVR